jgi:phage-related protein
MPQTEILLFRKADKEIPLLGWLAELQQHEPKIWRKCLAMILLLEAEGFQLRRPHAEHLGEGIYELRIKAKSVNYRILYFFHGKNIAILTHGFTKEAKVPPAEINYAKEARKLVESDPECYTAIFGGDD